MDRTHYRRTVAIDTAEKGGTAPSGGTAQRGDVRGWVAVSLAKGGAALEVEMSLSLAPAVGVVIARLKNLFDLGAAPDAVSELLSQDRMLARVVRRLPGLRVPGAFDGYELAVRAVLGQQVSVKAATTLAGRWASEFGAEIQTPFPELNRLAPRAPRMAAAAAEELTALGIVRSRARAVIALSEAVNKRTVSLSHAANVEEQIAALEGLPGIGPWTAQYIAMRALHWPDAFPGGDLMLQRAAKAGKKALQERAEGWRPWRAYAAHYLWQSLGDDS